MTTTYHTPLFARLLVTTTLAAQKGWTPRDLCHLFGEPMLALLHREGETILGSLNPPHRDTWAEELGSLPPSPPTMPSFDLRLTSRLLSLPPMEGSEYLHSATRRREGPRDEQEAKHRAKIEKLLAKAQSTSFSEEAESLIAKAQELQQRYRISHLTEEKNSSSPGTRVRARRVYLHAPWIKHQFLLLGAIARPNSCRAILVHSQGIVTVLGAPEDLDATLHLFSCLNHLRDHFMRNSDAAREAARRKDTNSFRRSFCLAYAARIGELLEEANEEAWESPEHKQSMLPVLRRRAKAVETTVSLLYPSLSYTRVSGNSWAGFDAGRTAAEKAYRHTRFRALDQGASSSCSAHTR